MSFGFQFDESEVDNSYLEFIGEPTVSSVSSSGLLADGGSNVTKQREAVQLTVEELLESLPSRISYSPIRIPLDGGRETILMRRDLFDARFQMLLEEDDDKEEPHLQDTTDRNQDEKNVIAGVESDLVPGVYEGGLKTWECALDLVATLEQVGAADQFTGKRVFEIGCGTAIPSVYLLQQLFNRPPPPPTSTSTTTLCLSDYNQQVLELVTLPNLILAWYFSEASLAFRTDPTALDQHQLERDDLLKRGQSHYDSSSSELSFTPLLISSFAQSLQDFRIQLCFFSGSWASLISLPILSHRFDLVFTSETIYSLETLPLLVKLLCHCCTTPTLSLSSPLQTTHPLSTLCLVAAKILYFGVGGGVQVFQQVLQQHTLAGYSQPFRSVSGGIERVVLSVGFSPSSPLPLSSA